MPKFTFKGFDGHAHYVIRRDKLVLRYRFSSMKKYREKSSRFRASRNEKRAFFEWAKKFLFSGGNIDGEWKTTEEADAQIMKQVDGSMTLGEAIPLYLDACIKGNSRMKPKAAATLRTQTEPVLRRYTKSFGEHTLLSSIEEDQIADFVRSLGGKKETKQRRLCPISNMFKWAKREGYLKGENPAHGILFWRDIENGERAHDGTRKSYTDEEFKRLLEAAHVDPFALDGIYLCRYLALRPQDAVWLRWEDWKWDQLLVAVRRRKTTDTGIEVSQVELHPVLVERYRSFKNAEGYCLNHPGRRTKIAWLDDAELRRRVKERGLSAVGRELGVSCNAVKKRLLRNGSSAPDMDREALGYSLSNRVSRITKEAGLYEKGVQPTYVLRHTFASDNLRRGVPPATVAKEMGISIDTLMKYYYHPIPRGELDDRRRNRWGVSRDDV